MQRLPIKTISSDTISQYNREKNHTFLRRDIYRFANYVFNYDLQRSYRENDIPKTAAKKLAKILSYKDEAAYVEKNKCGYWSNFISYLAMGMKLVSFNTKGEYKGYSSMAPSYPDNYIVPCQSAWEQYLRLSSLDKEWAILEGLNSFKKNEFHQRPTLVPYERRFDSSGSAVNAASKMELPKIRSCLLAILYQLKPNVWYSFSDMVSYVKKNHFNLIIDHQKRDGHTKNNIYDCFYEFPIKDGQISRDRTEIREEQSDAFERVEGRYLSFFLEEIPFLMGFVNLAYEKGPYQSVFPYYGYLKAFSLTQKFFTVYGKDPSYNQGKVTVQPNHEIVVQYSGYAEEQFQFLQKYTKLIKDDQSLIFRLEKKKIADRVAEGEDIQSIIQKFSSLSPSPIPKNIITEMQSWGSHGEKITLYRGYSLLEIEKKKSKELTKLDEPIQGCIKKKITSNIFLIRNSEHIYQYLEDKGYFPEKFAHHRTAFLYHGKTHSMLKRTPVKKKSEAPCEISFPKFVGLLCVKTEILSQVEQQLQKKEIQTYLFPKKNLLLVPLTFKKSLEVAVQKAIDKGKIEVKIID